MKTQVEQYAELRTIIYQARSDAQNYGKRILNTRSNYTLKSAAAREVYQRLYSKFLEQRFAKLSTEEQQLLHAWNKYLTYENMNTKAMKQ